MKSQMIINRQIAVFYNFIFMPQLGVFRIMEEEGRCRLILTQRVLVNVCEPLYLHDLSSIPVLSMCANPCGMPIGQYERDYCFATFFRLRCRRYWIPELDPRVSGEGVVDEWAEYHTEDYLLRFHQYNENLKK